jgi:predicted small lipoprotein YifL
LEITEVPDLSDGFFDVVGATSCCFCNLLFDCDRMLKRGGNVMRKILALVVIGLFTFGVMACGKTAPKTPAKAPPQAVGEVKVQEGQEKQPQEEKEKTEEKPVDEA